MKNMHTNFCFILFLAEKLFCEWTHWRSDYHKLHRGVDNKSGQGSVKYTKLQKWKPRRLAFLAPFIVHRYGQGIEMGGVSNL